MSVCWDTKSLKPLLTIDFYFYGFSNSAKLQLCCAIFGAFLGSRAGCFWSALMMRLHRLILPPVCAPMRSGLSVYYFCPLALLGAFLRVIRGGCFLAYDLGGGKCLFGLGMSLQASFLCTKNTKRGLPLLPCCIYSRSLIVPAVRSWAGLLSGF